MKKTKIGFEDIKAGDFLEVVGKFAGVKSVNTGVAFEQDVTEDEEKVWQTSEGGNIVMQWDKDTIYRIDVTAEYTFDDIRVGDLVMVSFPPRGGMSDNWEITHSRTGIAYHLVDVDRGLYAYWITGDGQRLVGKDDDRAKIEILERNGE